MENPNPPPRRWLQILVIALLGVALLGLIVWGIKSLMGGKPGKPRKPSTVTLMPDKPPPPPPREEKKPEPKEDKKEVKIEPPREQVAQPAQNEPLKMEGAAGEGGSPFGAGTVGREYSGGSVGALGGAGTYAGRLQRHFQEQLSRTRKLRESDYRLIVKIWLRRDGTLDRAELAGTTGSERLDELLRESLQQIPPMREALPENLMQPLRIRVTNRGAA